MGVHRIPGLLATMLLAMGCSGVPPSPQELAADLPPARPIAPEDSARASELGDRALDQAEAQDFAAARHSADEALALNPWEARARAALALCFFVEASEEQPPELTALNRAEGEFLRAEKIDPVDPLVGLHHARFLAAVGHLNAAVDRLEKLVEANPDNLELLRTLSRIQYDLGHESRASEVFMQVLRLDPNDALSHYLLAHCLLRLAPEFERSQRASEYEKAADEFARYRELVPEDVDGLLGEAHARFQAMLAAEGEGQQDPDLVLALYAQALQLDPEVVAAWFSQAVVLDHLQRQVEARASYEKALELDPAHLPSLLNLAANLSEAGEDDLAQQYLGRALSNEALSRSERQRIEELLAK